MGSKAYQGRSRTKDERIVLRLFWAKGTVFRFRDHDRLALVRRNAHFD